MRWWRADTDDRLFDAREGTMMPQVSVVIPAFNAADTLTRAIDSVLEQTVGDHEVIVCNDGSSDATPEILERYGSQVIALHQDNAGRSAARNRCLEVASAPFVAFLDADDWWLPTKLELQLSAAQQHPECDVFYGNLHIVNAEGNIYRSVNGRWHVAHSGWIFPFLVRNNFVPTSTVLVRRDALDAVGLFDTALPRCQDLDLFLRLAERSRFHYSNVVLGYYDDRTWGTTEKRTHTYLMFLQVLDKASGLFPDLAREHAHYFAKSYSDCYCELARFHEEQHEPAKVAEYYGLALSHTPRARVIQWRRALALYAAGDFETSSEALSAYLEQDPHHVDARFYLGNALMALHRAGDARLQYEYALYGGYLYQQFPECVNNLGTVYARLHQQERAAELFEQALQQQDFYSDAMRNLDSVRRNADLDELKWTRRKVF